MTDKKFEIYMTKIRRAYASVDQVRKDMILSGLESVVEEAQSPSFDAERARSIRKDKGFTKEELAMEAGTDISTIIIYESGNAPKKSPKRKADWKYFEWLGEHGYEPYKDNTDSS